MTAIRVIFLDFDGVLNSMRWESRRHESKAGYADRGIDPAGVGLVNQLVDRTGAVIVVSSTWRCAGLQSVRAILKARGCIGSVIGVTPELQDYRGKEIQAWLDEYDEVGSFVILDDSDDMLHLSSRLVLTKGMTGITQQDVDRAVEILARPCGLLAGVTP